MKRAAILFGAIAVLLQADGLWMEISNYNGPNTGNLFGNQNINLSEGEVCLMLAGFLMLGAVIMTLVAFYRSSQQPAAKASQSRPVSRV